MLDDLGDSNVIARALKSEGGNKKREREKSEQDLASCCSFLRWRKFRLPGKIVE